MSDSASGDNTAIADALLHTFCLQIHHIYGHKTVTPNMHMHCYLVKCVKDFGPMNLKGIAEINQQSIVQFSLNC